MSTPSHSHGGAPHTASLITDPAWSSEVRVGLRRMLEQDPRGIATFDFDDTLLDGDLSLALLAHLEALEPKGQRAHYEAACARDVRAGYAELVETLLVGRTEKEVRDLTTTALERGLADGTLRFRSALVELIWVLQRHGWEVWVVTASPAVVIQVAAQRIGIGADRVLGMWCRSEQGRFVGPTQEPVTYRQGKVDALATVGRQRPTFAAGDAPTDLEMLGEAKYGLVVDRGNTLLREAAERHGWWIEADL